ncbi:MAG TPA: pilin [Candidatus Dormibacteraeota bacterium]|nr:pilin [Candidatus Dormibacteraeota bacterium]
MSLPLGTDSKKEGYALAAINGLFTNLLNIGVGVAVTVAAFFLMWGAFLYMSAAGSPHQMERGKSAMVNALAGLAIVLSARLIAGLIQTALGTGH